MNIRLLKNLSLLQSTKATLWNLFKIVSPILFVLLLYTVGKRLYDHIKYGISLNPFQKQPRGVEEKGKVIYNMLKKIPGERSLFRVKNLTADLIMVDKTGIYLLYVLKYTGIITGTKESADLKEQIGLYQVRSIPNFLHAIAHDEQQLTSLNLPFETWIILHNACIYKGPIEKHYKVLHNKEFFYKMQTHLKQRPNILEPSQLKEVRQLMEKRLR